MSKTHMIKAINNLLAYLVMNRTLLRLLYAVLRQHVTIHVCFQEDAPSMRHN
jgi:hypothetical protein